MNRSNTEFTIFILVAIILISALTFLGGSAALQEQLYNAVVMTLWLGAAVILLARAFDYTTPGDWMVTIQEGGPGAWPCAFVIGMAVFGLCLAIRAT